MSNQAEMDKVLDEFEAQLHDDQVEDEQLETEEVEAQEEQEAGQQVDEEEKPPGFMGYEEWVAAGKDPKKFRGEEAYKAHYESLQEIKTLKDSVGAIAEGMASWKEAQRKQENERVAKAIAETKAKLAQAEEEEDVSAALQAQRELTDLENKASEVETPEKSPNPILVEFQSKYPIIDQSSTQFDKEFYDDMVMMQGTIIDKLTGGNEARLRALTPAQIQRSLDIAYRDTKGLHPDKFTSPKNTRRSAPPPKQKRQPSTPDIRSRLKGVGANGMNKQDKDPAVDMYDMLKGIDPKKAEAFALSVLGEN